MTGVGQMLVIVALDLVWVVYAVAFGIPVPAATFVAQLLKANALAMVLNIDRTRTVHRLERARWRSSGWPSPTS